MDILMPVPLPALVRDGLAGRFRVRTLWDSSDPEAMLGELGPTLRAIATGAPILAEDRSCPIDAAFMARFPKLEIVANLGVGYDNIDAKAAAAPPASRKAKAASARSAGTSAALGWVSAGSDTSS